MKKLIDIYADLEWRGLIYQTTDPRLQSWLMDKPRTVYAGFDPTADSLHVGSLMPLLMLKRFQVAGHQPVAVLGGATGMIGDPSGKSDERNLLTSEQLEANLCGIEKQIRDVLTVAEGPQAIVVNNADWIGRFSYIEYLRDVGKNFPVNVMMAKDSVKSRLVGEAGISYTEFSYMLLQAYDFVHLYREYNCELQIGGSDQWGNITAGIDLARRMDGVQLRGITHPLLTKSDGTKMGKTETGTVWLSSVKTSPYQFYQYWVNVDDEDTGRCLRFLTHLPQEEVQALDQARENEPEARLAQKRLAEEMTRMIHGDSGLQVAMLATEYLFGAEIGDLDDAKLGQVFQDVPSVTEDWNKLKGEGFPLVDALVKAGLAKSKGAARRTIEQGGAYVNNRRATSVDRRLSDSDLASESMIVLRSGKRNFALLRFK